jgi:two-component system cell cycle sensor histidine kinase/response regulator CckA
VSSLEAAGGHPLRFHPGRRRARGRPHEGALLATPGAPALEALYSSMAMGVIYQEVDGRISAANPAACRILGLSLDQVLGHGSMGSAWRAVREDGSPFPEDEQPAMVALRTGRPVRAVVMGIRTSRPSRTRWIEVSAVPEALPDAPPHRVYSTFDDITQRFQHGRVAAARLRILEIEVSYTLEDLLRATLDEAEKLTDSQIGFFHFLEEDQATVRLQTWSTRTLKEMCTAVGEGLHYPVEQAGIWADAVRFRRTVVHNDYPSEAGRHGLPPGHAEVMRELVVPVLRGGLVRAVLGVGNKAVAYDEEDHAIVAAFADLAWDVVDRRRALDALSASEQRFRDLTSTLGDWVWEIDEQWHYTYVSDTVTAVLGHLPSEVLGRTPFELMAPEEARRIRAEYDALAASPAPFFERESAFLHKDGTVRHCVISGVPVRGPPGGVRGWRGTGRDVTARKRAEAEREHLQAQLAQAQRLESVGRLAGGIAHDFNNMLSAIIGCAEMAHDNAPEGSELRANLAEILTAARRSADLTRQLLAFARQQPIRPRALDLNDVVPSMLKMLRRLLGENVRLTFAPGPELWTIELDPSQLDQILANLAVNASDAISKWGEVEIQTYNRTVSVGETARLGRVAGDYVVLCVKDDGAGMSPQVQEHLFEPFFTTKERGKGTGLGLSTVDGIVSQNGGFIEVSSALGMGSSFEVCFPRWLGPAARAPGPVAAPVTGGYETVLVVEDEEALLRIVRYSLEGLGYRVLAAQAPRQALAMATAHEGAIDLVVADVVLPEMSGVEVVKRLKALRPATRALFVSGYPADVTDRQGLLPDGLRLLSKPFGRCDLARAVREALGSG